MHPFTGHDVARQGIDQWPHQCRDLADHIGQRRTAEVDVFTGVDLSLAMQRQVVAILPHQHMRQQTRAGATAADRQAGSRRLDNRLTHPARQFRTDMADDAERAGHIVQDLCDILAERTQGAPTVRAGTGGGMLDDIARQGLGSGWRAGLRSDTSGCVSTGSLAGVISPSISSMSASVSSSCST
jgi:hypothetical protein